MNLPALPSVIDSLKVIAAALTSIGVILSFFEKGRTWLLACWHWLTGLITHKDDLHRVDLIIQPDHNFCQWQEGNAPGFDEAMLVYCKLFITNVAKSPAFQILDVYIKKPFTRGFIHPAQRPDLPTKAQLDGARLAHMFEARFTVAPPVVKSRNVFTCDVILVDQFGRKHNARAVSFQPVHVPVWEMARKQREHEKEQARQLAQHLTQITEIQQQLREDDAKKVPPSNSSDAKTNC